MNNLKFLKTKDVKTPNRAGPSEAGIDFYIPNDFKKTTLRHGDSILIGLGIKIKFPDLPFYLRSSFEYAMILTNKSGIAYRKRIKIGSCVIDTSYQGEIMVNLHNDSKFIIDDEDGRTLFKPNESATLSPGEKIVQGIVHLVDVSRLKEVFSEKDLFNGKATKRGTCGLGSNFNDV